MTLAYNERWITHTIKVIAESFDTIPNQPVSYVFHRGSKVNGRMWNVEIFRIKVGMDVSNDRPLLSIKAGTSTELLAKLESVERYISGLKNDRWYASIESLSS